MLVFWSERIKKHSELEERVRSVITRSVESVSSSCQPSLFRYALHDRMGLLPRLTFGPWFALAEDKESSTSIAQKKIKQRDPYFDGDMCLS